MRLLTSLSFVFWWISLCFGQAFGRFGYSEAPSIPGIILSRDSIRAKSPSADKLSFAQPLKTWRPVLTDEFQQVVETDSEGPTPAKLKLNLLGSGVGLYCPTEFELKVTSLSSPVLTWTEGSVMDGVPTPDLKWCLLSFQDRQPAWLMATQDGSEVSWKVEGKAGAWVIKSKGLKGWLRMGLPLGNTTRATVSAAALGKIVKDIQPVLPHFQRPTPTLKILKVVGDLQSVTAIWTFDLPQAIVPIAAKFAEAGGYPIGVDSPSIATSMTTEEGPMDFLKGNELRIRFPIRRVPAGRAVVVGGTAVALGTVSPFDVPSLVELAFENLVSYRDIQTLRTAEDCLTEFLGQATFKEEPWTKQQLPYSQAGSDLDLIAAQGLLCEVMSSVRKGNPDSNALLTSLQWRTDWHTWQLGSIDANVNRRAAAIAAMAGAFSTSPEKRLAAAMLQAGLSAQRGLQIWRERQGQTQSQIPLIETMLEMRQPIFSLRIAQSTASSWLQMLQSPVRIYGDASASIDATGVLEWTCIEPKPNSFWLGSETSVKLEKLDNLAKFITASAFGLTEVRYTAEVSGLAKAKFGLPKWAKKIPLAKPIERFSEKVR